MNQSSNDDTLMNPFNIGNRLQNSDDQPPQTFTQPMSQRLKEQIFLRVLNINNQITYDQNLTGLAAAVAVFSQQNVLGNPVPEAKKYIEQTTDQLKTKNILQSSRKQKQNDALSVELTSFYLLVNHLHQDRDNQSLREKKMYDPTDSVYRELIDTSFPMFLKAIERAQKKKQVKSNLAQALRYPYSLYPEPNYLSPEVVGLLSFTGDKLDPETFQKAVWSIDSLFHNNHPSQENSYRFLMERCQWRYEKKGDPGRFSSEYRQKIETLLSDIVEESHAKGWITSYPFLDNMNHDRDSVDIPNSQRENGGKDILNTNENKLSSKFKSWLNQNIRKRTSTFRTFKPSGRERA